jgi:hypothetical protein
MRNNAFDRVLLLLILAGIIYLAVVQPKKPESSNDRYFQYLPYNGSAGDTTASDGSGGKNPGPKLKADTVVLYSKSGLVQPPDCPCCPQTYAMMYYSSTDTSGRSGGPHLTMIDLSVLSTTDSSGTTKPPRK